MENASDKVAQSESKKGKRIERETPISEHRRDLAKQERDRRGKNPIVETYYELVRGHKLVLCKVKKSGSVYRVLVGAIAQIQPKDPDERASQASLKAKIEKLRLKDELRIRL